MAKRLDDCYARILVDSHITEHNPSFMTRFDPATFVHMLKDAGFQSAMVYACCHNGNCYYPTKIGHMHANLNGRDLFGETVSLLRKNDIVPLAYYTVIYFRMPRKTIPSGGSLIATVLKVIDGHGTIVPIILNTWNLPKRS
jgi:hypothetical protein